MLKRFKPRKWRNAYRDRRQAQITRSWAARLGHADLTRLFNATMMETPPMRVVRPDVDLERVAASVAGLSSRRWRDPSGFGSLLDVPPGPGERGHDPRPPEYQQHVKDDWRRQDEEERAESSWEPRGHGPGASE
jgi:hypothetical protein